MTRAWNNPDKAMVVAHVRSGGTFLCHALDSHPQIGCERGEPLHTHEQFMRATDCDVVKVMTVLHFRPGYHVTAFKATVKQFAYVPDEYLAKNDVAMIFLHRENMLRVHVSSEMIGTVNPAHSFENDGHSRQVVIDTNNLPEIWRQYIQNIDAARQRCKKARRYLELTYEQITHGQENGYLNQYVSDLLCDFLAVERRRLYSETKKRTPQPLKELIANYDQVEAVLYETEYYKFLGDEQ